MATVELKAPGRLAIVQSFVNANFSEEPDEDSRRPRSMHTWLEQKGLSPGSALAAGDVQRLLELRGLIREAIGANHARETLPATATRRLNKIFSAGVLRLELDGDGHVALVADRGGADGIIGAFATMILDAAREGTWQRLQLCRADDCAWAFYDQSKNRSRVWCSMSSCGNRAKARAFRERREPEGKRA